MPTLLQLRQLGLLSASACQGSLLPFLRCGAPQVLSSLSLQPISTDLHSRSFSSSTAPTFAAGYMGASFNAAMSKDGEPPRKHAPLRDLRAGTTQLPSEAGWLQGPGKDLHFEEWEGVPGDTPAQTYYRSKLTGETTSPGAEKPDTWTEVVDRQSGLLYYWNKRTGDATNLGEPKPGILGRGIEDTTRHEAAAKAEEERLADPVQNFSVLLNTPLGWFLGISTVGFVLWEIFTGGTTPEI